MEWEAPMSLNIKRAKFLLFLMLIAAGGSNGRSAAWASAARDTVIFSDNFDRSPDETGQWTIYRYANNPSREVEWSSTWNYIRLTEEYNDLGGAMFANIDLTTLDWRVTFRYRAGDSTGGEGILFMFYKDISTFVACSGDCLGGMPLMGGAGYGIEFDANDSGYLDPSGNHVALIQNNVYNHLTYVDDSRTEDYLWHNVMIEYQRRSCGHHRRPVAVHLYDYQSRSYIYGHRRQRFHRSSE